MASDCAVILRQAVRDARGGAAAIPSVVYVQSADRHCAEAVSRVADDAGVKRWRGVSLAPCPGPSCGPPDGNPLVTIRYEREGCFRVGERRGTGGHAVTRCVDERGGEHGPLGGDPVVY